MSKLFSVLQYELPQERHITQDAFALSKVEVVSLFLKYVFGGPEQILTPRNEGFYFLW